MSRQAEDTQERHDCAMQGCAAWGTQRFRGRIPDVLEYVDGWLCENHKITDPGAAYSIGFRDSQPVSTEAVGENDPIPFRPNRADRRKAARGKR